MGRKILDEEREKHFWGKVKIAGPDECWEWQAGKRRGYGHYKSKQIHYGAHCFAYIVSVGPIPFGMFVLHSCDNPPCCNPRHLHLGTQYDNLREMTDRGRRAHVGAKGESHHLAKLTESQVLEIRKKREETEVTQRALSIEYGVSQVLIGLIVRREIWRHI